MIDLFLPALRIRKESTHPVDLKLCSVILLCRVTNPMGQLTVEVGVGSLLCDGNDVISGCCPVIVPVAVPRDRQTADLTDPSVPFVHLGKTDASVLLIAGGVSSPPLLVLFPSPLGMPGAFVRAVPDPVLVRSKFFPTPFTDHAFLPNKKDSRSCLSSIFVCRCLIPVSCFPVVAPLAECLPVRLIPEEFRISSVRNDVVHDRCRCCNSSFQALLTERMKL